MRKRSHEKRIESNGERKRSPMLAPPSESQLKLERKRSSQGARIRSGGRWVQGAVLATGLAIPLAAFASSVTVPNFFVNGDVADATEVNQNFTDLAIGINDNDSRISSLESLGGDITAVIAGAGMAGGGSSGSLVLAVDPSQVQSRVSGACAVGSSIRSIGSDGSVACQTDTGGAGDLTALTVGAGLTGGGTSGAVNVAVAPSGISSNMIANGTITGSDISPSADLTVRALSTTGAVVFGGSGGVTIDSLFDVVIQDDFNGFRWKSSDGADNLGSITVREEAMTMTHDGQGQEILRSTSVGIGLGGAAPTSSHLVTAPSLTVTGNLGVGLQRVSMTYDLDSTSSSCHSAGGLPCFYGSGTVSCPVGTRVLGGGTTGSSALFGSVSQSFPNGNSSWSCGASYDIASSTRTCYAICGRIN